MSDWRFDDCPRLTLNGRWWRMLSPRWHREPLSGAGAARQGGRWNARGMPALYFSANHETAIAEYMQSLIHPGTLTPYDVNSVAILDLTDPSARQQAGVDDALLTLSWRHVRDIEARDPETWDFARAALAAGFVGLRVPSVQTQSANLVVWQWGAVGADVRVIDPEGQLK